MVDLVWRTYRDAYSGLPKEVWFLSFALFINRCGCMVLAFMTLYLTEEVGFGEAGAGRMMSMYGIGAILGNYIGGRLTNRVGAVRLQILMLLASAPMFLVVAACQTWQGIAASFFVLSFFFEAVRPPNSTAIAQFTSNELQPKAFALQRMAGNLGISFGPFIGGYLAEIDYYWIFFAETVTTLAGAMILVYFFGLKRYSKTMSREQRVALEENVAKKTQSPLKDGKFLILLAFVLATMIVFFQFHGMYPLYMKDHFGLSKPGIGKLYAINTVSIVLFEMVVIDRVRRYNPIKVIAWGSLLSCLGFGIMPFESAIWFAVLCMIILTVGEMLSMPVCSAWVGVRSERGDRAMYMGWYTMTYSLAAVISPTLGGVIYEFDKELFWYLSIATGFVVLAGFYWLAALLEKEKAAEASLTRVGPSLRD